MASAYSNIMVLLTKNDFKTTATREDNTDKTMDLWGCAADVQPKNM